MSVIWLQSDPERFFVNPYADEPPSGWSLDAAEVAHDVTGLADAVLRMCFNEGHCVVEDPFLYTGIAGVAYGVLEAARCIALPAEARAKYLTCAQAMSVRQLRDCSLPRQLCVQRSMALMTAPHNLFTTTLRVVW